MGVQQLSFPPSRPAGLSSPHPSSALSGAGRVRLGYDVSYATGASLSLKKGCGAQHSEFGSLKRSIRRNVSLNSYDRAGIDVDAKCTELNILVRSSASSMPKPPEIPTPPCSIQTDLDLPIGSMIKPRRGNIGFPSVQMKRGSTQLKPMG